MTMKGGGWDEEEEGVEDEEGVVEGGRGGGRWKRSSIMMDGWINTKRTILYPSTRGKPEDVV